ncbi:GH12 family glycosyl hydrolase domain-containing protein [Actinomycetospora termitidis]|uniref:Glycosyl hydrolase family 12 n=1 Tax=Actinomycetospora termitidis TaxID=3053470 RepID=A0ABT7M8E4_9PSEU|nr:hypothetical protein [Actinomycetospora sp. Odt1-22]MDL5156931.1 hypothetical protein [Actinomycetospora sp. Odt1-22]
MGQSRGASSAPLRGRHRRLVVAAAVVLLALLTACAGPQETVPPITVAPGEAQNVAGAAPLPAPLPALPSAVPVVPKVLAPLSAIGSRNGPRICEKFRSAPVAGGRFEVQNNAWGAETPQCTTAFDTGFSVQANHAKDSGPAAYPSIVWGCNHGTCTRGTPFPRPLSDLGDVRSSWAVSVPDRGRYNAAYDIWLDPTPRRDGDNTGAELMIWTIRAGGIDPIGSKRGSVDLGGADWDVWTGENNGVPVISYVRKQSVRQVIDLPITDFVRDAQRQGVVQPSWYLTNLQAGFEPWVGGSGLSTDAFNATRNGA